MDVNTMRGTDYSVSVCFYLLAAASWQQGLGLKELIWGQSTTSGLSCGGHNASTISLPQYLLGVSLGYRDARNGSSFSFSVFFVVFFFVFFCYVAKPE
jgi:hypothetical protein